jgi:hypothetical protein
MVQSPATSSPFITKCHPQITSSLHWTVQSSQPHKTTQSITFLHIFFVIWKEVTKRQAKFVNRPVTDFISEFTLNLRVVCSHSKQIQLKCTVRRIISITYFTGVIPYSYTLQVCFSQSLIKRQAYAAENVKQKEPPTPEGNWIACVTAVTRSKLWDFGAVCLEKMREEHVDGSALYPL